VSQNYQDTIEQAKTFLERILARRGMLRIALGAFVVGILLHVCVVYAVLDDGGKQSRSAAPRPISSTPVAAAATATRPNDRTNCDAIRGSDYRSEAERQWFLTNCRVVLP
jgi:hypothetical protein